MYHNKQHRAVTRDVKDMTPEAIDQALGEWYFRQDTHGDWRGFHEDGRRTALKTATRDHTAMQHAQNDVLNGRILCSQWPNCQHYTDGKLSESIEACVVAGRYEREKHTALGLKQDQRRQFRGRREYNEV
jgi:hypothetical protein